MKSEILLTLVIWFFVMIFFIIACVKCRRIRLLPSLMIIISVTFFSVLSPAGEVLISFCGFRITFDSLLLGLRRSGILVGMVFLSRSLISQKSRNSFLKKCGKLGNKVTEVLFWLNLLTEKKLSFKKGHIIEAIDERLCEIWQKGGENDDRRAF